MSEAIELNLRDLDLPQERLGLRVLETRYPHLATGPGSPVFQVADLPPPARAWLLGASWPLRLVALGLDLVPCFLLWLLALRGFNELSYLHPEPFLGPQGVHLVRLGTWGSVLLVYLLYFTTWEWLLGWTPGKMVAGIRVVDDYGRRPSLKTAFLRSIHRVLDGLLLGSLALSPLALAREPRRRRGDHATRTWVVET